MRDTTPAQGIDARILADTRWSDLSEPILERMLERSRVRSVAARAPIIGLGDTDPRAGILLSGTARAFLAAADGRQLSVRYLRRGDLVARRSYLLGGHSPVALHAVTDVEFLELDAPAFVRLVESESSVARVVLAELSRRLEDVHATVADSAFGSVREKVARHLLAMSDDGRVGERRIAPITQQQLADGVGSMREVVARALREFRHEGIIATSPGAIEILDPARLAGSLGTWQVVAASDAGHAPDDVEALIDVSPDASVVVNANGTVVFMNRVAEKRFGWSRNDLIGHPVELLIPESLRAAHVNHRNGFLDDPVPRPMSLRSGLCGRRRDGTEFPISVGLSVVDTGEGTMVLATVVDRSPNGREADGTSAPEQ